MTGQKRGRKRKRNSSNKGKSDSMAMDGTDSSLATMKHSSMKTPYDHNKIAELPLDLIVDILLRLPIKPLIAFSATSRLMYSLIYHPFFINLHYKRALGNGGFLLKANNRGYKRRRIQKLNQLGFFRESEPTVQLVFESQEAGGGHHSVVSSCNGLICMVNFREWIDPIGIYNPATRESVQIPLSEAIPTYDAALVYDWENHVYKVFRLFLSKGDYNPAEARFDAFSLGESSDTWREHGVVPYYHNGTNHHKQSGGAVNWMFGDMERFHSVLSIDIVTEKWKVHPIPQPDNPHHQSVLIELDGNLALCGINFDLDMIKIWVLKDVENSTWEMVHWYNSPKWIARPANVRTGVCQTSFRHNKLLIWRGRNKLVFYDTQTGKSKRVDTTLASKGWINLQVIDHIETLVPCKDRWKAVQWPEINDILYDFCPNYGYPQRKMEIREYEEDPDTTLKL